MSSTVFWCTLICSYKIQGLWLTEKFCCKTLCKIVQEVQKNSRRKRQNHSPERQLLEVKEKRNTTLKTFPISFLQINLWVFNEFLSAYANNSQWIIYLTFFFLLFVGHLKANWFLLTYLLLKIMLVHLSVSAFPPQWLCSTVAYWYHQPEASTPPSVFHTEIPLGCIRSCFQSASAGSLFLTSEPEHLDGMEVSVLRWTTGTNLWTLLGSCFLN